jgi:hypothetical protein
MSLEERLFAITLEAIGGQFASFSDLAQKVRDAAPPEFSYNRLEERHVMQPASIVPYVSLLHLLGILRTGAGDVIECMLDEETTQEGFVALVDRKAIEFLTATGFTRDGYLKVVKRLLRQANIVLPTLREIYQGLPLKVSEAQFIQLCALGGVRNHFGFALVTRRVMLPSQV